MSLFSWFKKDYRRDSLRSREVRLAEDETNIQTQAIKSDLSNLQGIKMKKEAENALSIAEDTASMVKSFATKKAELAEKFNAEWREVEHNWHQGKEEKNTELAKLNAKIEAQLEFVERIDEAENETKSAIREANIKVLEVKDAALAAEKAHSVALGSIITSLVGRIPVMDMKALNIDVDCKVPQVQPVYPSGRQ